MVPWSGYPAIRFAYENWPKNSVVVLFLDAREGKSFCINYYCGDISNDEERKRADEHYHEQDCGEPWNEVRETCRCYKARFENLNSDSISAKLAHKLKLMNTFETKIRPSLED